VVREEGGEMIQRYTTFQLGVTFTAPVVLYTDHLAALAEKDEMIATLKNVILSDERQVKNLVKRNEELRADLIKTAYDRDVFSQRIAALIKEEE
jgi:hypothetical protein